MYSNKLKVNIDTLSIYKKNNIIININAKNNNINKKANDINLESNKSNIKTFLEIAQQKLNQKKGFNQKIIKILELIIL